MKEKAYVYNDVCDANKMPMIKEVLYQWHAKDDEITDIAIFTDGSMGCFDRVINKWYSYKEPSDKYKYIVNHIRQIYGEVKSEKNDAEINGHIFISLGLTEIGIDVLIKGYAFRNIITQVESDDWKEIIKYLPIND